jgi:hypothetical protein
LASRSNREEKVKITLERAAFAPITDARLDGLREIIFEFDEDGNIIDCIGVSHGPAIKELTRRIEPALAALSRMAQIRFNKQLLNLAREQSASATVIPFPVRA